MQLNMCAGAYRSRFALPCSRVAVACFALFALAGCDIEDFGPSDRFHADFHYTFELKPGGHLSVENFNGQVEVEGWDQDQVEVTGTKFASTKDMLDLIKIETHATPDRVDLRTVRPSVRRGNMGAKYLVHVPKKVELDRINSSNGHVRITNVEGPARVKTSNGGVRAINIGGAVDAQTSNGPIDVEGIHGSASMHTSNGRVHAENVDGQCEADTSNGTISVRLNGASTAPLKFTTTNGSIEVNMQGAPKGDIRANTSNGGITVHLPTGASAHLKADTSNASISSDFDVNTTVSGKANSKRHLDGTIGSGGPVIELSTNNGSIRLLKGI